MKVKNKSKLIRNAELHSLSPDIKHISIAPIYTGLKYILIQSTRADLQIHGENGMSTIMLTNAIKKKNNNKSPVYLWCEYCVPVSSLAVTDPVGETHTKYITY